MMKLHEFYRKYESLPKDRQFEAFQLPAETTSLFVIFQQLAQVRAQIRHYEAREAHLLKIAEEHFDV